MSQSEAQPELAVNPSVDYFRELQPGAVIKLYLALTKPHFFWWTHSTVELDLIYGSIEFDDYPGAYPKHAYLFDSGHGVCLSMPVLKHSLATSQRIDLGFYGAHIYLSEPLPSQYPRSISWSEQRSKNNNSKPLKPGEIKVLKDAVQRICNSGFSKDSVTSFSVQKYNGEIKPIRKPVFAFEVSGKGLKANVFVKKYKGDGLLAPPKWLLKVYDHSNRYFHEADLPEGIVRIQPGSTRVAYSDNLQSVNDVYEEVISAFDCIVARNRH